MKRKDLVLPVGQMPQPGVLYCSASSEQGRRTIHRGQHPRGRFHAFHQ